MMGLDDFLKRHPPRERGTRKWLLDRPELLAEVLRAHKDGVSMVLIHRYLVEEHGLEIGYARFHVLLTELARRK